VTWQDWVTLASLAGVIGAVVLGRRKGRGRFAASIASAVATGEANARAELAAQLTQSVTVVANSSDKAGTDDLLLAALRRIAATGDGGGMPGLERSGSTNELPVGSGRGQHSDYHHLVRSLDDDHNDRSTRSELVARSDSSDDYGQLVDEWLAGLGDRDIPGFNRPVDAHEMTNHAVNVRGADAFRYGDGIQSIVDKKSRTRATPDE
jgi:hypothetical protein